MVEILFKWILYAIRWWNNIKIWINGLEFRNRIELCMKIQYYSTLLALAHIWCKPTKIFSYLTFIHPEWLYFYILHQRSLICFYMGTIMSLMWNMWMRSIKLLLILKLVQPIKINLSSLLSESSQRASVILAKWIAFNNIWLMKIDLL